MTVCSGKTVLPFYVMDHSCCVLCGHRTIKVLQPYYSEINDYVKSCEIKMVDNIMDAKETAELNPRNNDAWVRLYRQIFNDKAEIKVISYSFAGTYKAS